MQIFFGNELPMPTGGRGLAGSQRRIVLTPSHRRQGIDLPIKQQFSPNVLPDSDRFELRGSMRQFRHSPNLKF